MSTQQHVLNEKELLDLLLKSQKLFIFLFG